MKKKSYISILLTLTVLFTALFIPNNTYHVAAGNATTEFPWKTTKIMTNAEAVQRLLDVYFAFGNRIVYVNAAFGHTLEYVLGHDHIMNSMLNESRREYYEKRKDYGYFGFDCSGFIKSVLLWNWHGDYSHVYGGINYVYDAVDADGEEYNSQDINQDGFINVCENVNTNFNNIMPGEFLYKEGHCGIYIGNGYAIECTTQGDITTIDDDDSSYTSGVMITQVENMISGEFPKNPNVYQTEWTSHGKLTFIHYGDTAESGIKLKLNKHCYTPGEPIDITIEGINNTQYMYSRVYIYKISGSDYSGKSVIDRWAYAANGAHDTVPTSPPGIKAEIHINAASMDVHDDLVNLPEGDYMIVLHKGDVSTDILAQTTFQVSKPRICNASYVTIDRYGYESGEYKQLASENWLDMTICGEILTSNPNAWIGVYPEDETNYSNTQSLVWHYTSDYLITDYRSNTVAEYDLEYKNMRIRYDTDTPESLKAVLFLDGGYNAVSEHNISVSNKATDIKVTNYILEPKGELLRVGDTYASGEEIFIYYDGVTYKDAWIGLTRVNEVLTNTTGMWCYTSTGKQWTINNESNIVSRGRVVLSANTLDKNSGNLTPLPAGKYMVVLYRDGGFLPLAQCLITIT